MGVGGVGGGEGGRKEWTCCADESIQTPPARCGTADAPSPAHHRRRRIRSVAIAIAIARER